MGDGLTQDAEVGLTHVAEGRDDTVVGDTPPSCMWIIQQQSPGILKYLGCDDSVDQLIGDR